MRGLALVLLAAAGGGPATAGFVPPEGCTAWMTVQTRGCRVSNHHTCAQDAPGDQWREDSGLNGPYFRSRIDFETQWVESHDKDGVVHLIESPAADPANFSELIATGRDSYDFSTMSSAGVREVMRGEDVLPGKAVVIDGVRLERTRYKITVRFGDGSLSHVTRGSEFIHRDWRLFFGGTGVTDFGDGEGPLPFDFTPVEFHFPGDPGFGEQVPIYDCEPVAMAPGAGGGSPEGDMETVWVPYGTRMAPAAGGVARKVSDTDRPGADG